MAEIKARVSAADKTRFRALANAAGKNESEYLREMVAIVLDGGMPERQAPIRPPMKAAKAKAEAKLIASRVPAFIKEELKRAARAKGMTVSRYLAGIIQSHFTNYPILTDAELSALNHSNRELASIGRNLNQIARALNESFYETDRVKVELIKETVDLIKSNQKELKRFIRASNQAWGAFE